MLRKIISVVVAVALVFSWSSIAFAEGENPAKAKANPKARAYADLVKTTGGKLNYYEQDGRFFLSGKLSGPQTPGVQAATAFLEEYKALFGIKSVGLELKASRPRKDSTGDTFVRFDQLINGVKVYGSLVNVHFDKDGTIVSVNGRVLQDKRITNLGNAAVTQSSAVNTAKKLYQFDKLRDDAAKPEKVVLTKDGKNYVVYKVNVSFDKPTIGNYDVFVEATSGSVVLTQDKIRTDFPVTGTGVDVQGVTRDLNLTYLEDGMDPADPDVYGMVDETRSSTDMIMTWQSNYGKPDDGYIYLVRNDTNNFTSEEDKASVSAHYFAGVVVDFYKNMFGRNSIDDDNMPIMSITHYGDNYNNAFWSGYAMFYGDGDGTEFTYFSGDLDVVGHEMTHGVIDYTAELYYGDESGALNESVADVMGVMIETYEKYDVASGGTWTFDPADWVAGDEIYTPATTGDALRSLADPTLYGDPAHMDDYHYLPNTAEGDWGGVHTNSGIPNKAAYEIARQLGMEKTANIYYRALYDYMYIYSDFEDGMVSLVMAAEDLYGWYSDEAITVRKAFKGVGVDVPVYDPGEPNNYPDCANYLEPFEDYRSYITARNDYDYSIFYVDHTCGINIALSDIPANCNYDLILLSEDAYYNSGDADYDEADYVIGSSTQAGNAAENISITLDKGIYFIKVYPVNEGDVFSKEQMYTLRYEQSSLGVPVAKAVSASYNSVKVTWNWVVGAYYYDVYRATASGGPYTKLATLTDWDYPFSYISTGLTTNTVYYYKVKAYRSDPSMSVYSAVVSARPVPSAPTTFNVVSASYNSIKTSWSAVSGASGYELYRATSSTGAYTKLYSGTALSYVNTSLVTGSAYYYKVRAYRTVGSTKVYGPFTDAKGARPTLGVPASVKAARASATSIKVTWGGVTGASGYELWRSTASNGTYVLVKATTSLYFTNTGLATGTTYYYKVRAYRTVGSSKAYSAFSTITSAKP